ncbi:MAG: hypothetical protein V4750_17880 [Pseudomonadota bacterium]
MDQQSPDSVAACADGIRHTTAQPPVAVPPGHVGPVVVPGTGRLVWWTGRVAIGLRYQPERSLAAASQSALWIQDLMLKRGRAVLAA